jgi:hypothetical protein
MTEVQAHGNMIEDLIIKNITGVSKQDYQKLINEGYTSSLDIHKDVLSLFNGSVKSTGGNGIGCGDIMRFMQHCRETEFKFIVASYKQKERKKILLSVYEFQFVPEKYKIIFGDLTKEIIEPFVSYVKSIPYGKEHQLLNKKLWREKREEILCKYNTGLISINPKIDSKAQRRVQCSLHLSELLQSDIEYNFYDKSYYQINFPYEIDSEQRTFKKARSILH